MNCEFQYTFTTFLDQTHKFKIGNFKQLLLETSNVPLKLQADLINTRFDSWKHDTRQLDDVPVLGFKIA